MVRDSRKIAAILAADVVDYSRLMGADDAATLAALGVRRALFDTLVREFDGRVFGSVGDSLMAEFPSAVHAVESGQTKTVHRVKKGGSLKFKNGSKNKILTIQSPAPQPPLMVTGCADPVSEFTVESDSKKSVTISDAYDVGDMFTYTATIEDSSPEDPIVIIERR